MFEDMSGQGHLRRRHITVLWVEVGPYMHEATLDVNKIDYFGFYTL